VGFNNFEDRDNNNEEEEEETEHAVVVLFGTPIDMQRAQREREREAEAPFYREFANVCKCKCLSEMENFGAKIRHFFPS